MKYLFTKNESTNQNNTSNNNAEHQQFFWEFSYLRSLLPFLFRNAEIAENILIDSAVSSETAKEEISKNLHSINSEILSGVELVLNGSTNQQNTQQTRHQEIEGISNMVRDGVDIAIHAARGAAAITAIIELEQHHLSIIDTEVTTSINQISDFVEARANTAINSTTNEIELLEEFVEEHFNYNTPNHNENYNDIFAEGRGFIIIAGSAAILYGMLS